MSVDLGARAAIESFGPQRLATRLEQLAPDVIFGGEQEIEALGGEPQAPVLVVKRGAQGCTVVEDGRRSEHPAVDVQAIDTTGAGDAFAAGFLLEGPVRALEAAARCVATIGAMP